MLANYTFEQEQYRALVESDSELNILLFWGASGAGKSFLIDYCLQSTPDQPYSLLKLQNGGDTITNLFSQMGFQIGWEHLPTFTFTVAELLEERGKSDDHLWQVQMPRHLREISRISDLETRYSRNQLLSDAWFADVFNFKSPYLLVVDTYEKATTEFNQWFSDEFLHGVVNTGKMRALIAGQQVPELHPDWSFSTSLQELKGIIEAEAWMKWAEQEGYQISSLEEIQEIATSLRGRPSYVTKFIQSQFPKALTRTTPADSKSVVLESLLESLKGAFNLSELHEICFVMGIDHEDLPEHAIKSGLVLSLLRLVDRIGRLPELIGICERRRPQLEWQLV